MHTDNLATFGSLSIVKLNEKENDDLVDLLCISKGIPADFLNVLLGSDWLKFMDVMEGCTVKIPSREETMKFISQVKIYNYCKCRGFSDDSIDRAHRIFNRRKVSVIRIIEKMDKILAEEATLNE